MKKKVYVICGIGEYKNLYESLRDVIDISKEEILVPYNFLQFDGKEILKYLSLDTSREFRKSFSLKKFKHFLTYIDDIDKLLYLNDTENLFETDSVEKQLEYEFAKIHGLAVEVINIKSNIK